MAVGDVFRLSVVGASVDGRTQIVNTFHYRQDDALIFSEPGPDLVQAWLDDVDSDYRALISNIFSFNFFRVQGITSPLYVYEQTTASRLGTLTGEALPLTCAAVITWRTGLAGRSRRGRTYVPPANESAQNGSILTTSYIALMDAFADSAKAIPLTIAHSGYTMMVYSSVLGQSNAVTSHLSRNILGTQRRRRPGVGA